ncbi:MAG TPA: SDR family oxidoreductase [Marinilabiliaceae bacterium]|nr:SDR family oxidoreductase [Marinilabiliaceae bacterium]
MSNKTVLITGAAKRVGKALAKRFALEGWNVVIHYNSSKDEALEFSNELSQLFSQQVFPIVSADLFSGEQTLIQLFDDLSKLGINKLDALINNASNFYLGSLKDTDSTLLHNSFKVNFEAPFFLMRHFYLLYGSGSILNLLDTRVVGNESSHGAYSLSKKALMNVTTMAALEWAPSVRVNAIAPGPVLPPPGKDKLHLDKVIVSTPLQKRVELDNLVESAYFLTTNDAITGQIIFCDSGAHLK